MSSGGAWAPHFIWKGADMSVKDLAKPNLGAVMTLVASPTRVVLVKEMERPCALWKLPGGSIEPIDQGVGREQVIAASIRETLEETAIALARDEVRFQFEDSRDNHRYTPYLCVAEVSEEKLDTHARITDGDGKPTVVNTFLFDELIAMEDLLPRHRDLIVRFANASV